MDNKWLIFLQEAKDEGVSLDEIIKKIKEAPEASKDPDVNIRDIS